MVNQMKKFFTALIVLAAGIAFTQADTTVHTCSQAWNSNAGQDAQGNPVSSCIDFQQPRKCLADRCQPGSYKDRAGKTKIITDYSLNSESTMKITILNGGQHVVPRSFVTLTSCGYCTP